MNRPLLGPLLHRNALTRPTLRSPPYYRLTNYSQTRLHRRQATETTSDTDPPVLAPTPKQKPKLDLRPAPLKPPYLSSHPIPPHHASPSPTVSNYTDSEQFLEHEPAHHVFRRQPIIAALDAHVIPPTPPGLTRLKSLWFMYKQYTKFYWVGIKMIWKHRQYVADIRARIHDDGHKEPLTRWESRFSKTHKADMTKLPFFIFTFIILEEIIPLIILFAPTILPSTCILPSQLDKIRLAQDKAQATSLAGAYQLRSLQDGIEALKRKEAKLLCGIFRLSSFGPTSFLRARITRHLRDVAEDDAFLRREGRGSWLDVAGVRDALGERGVATQEMAPQQQRALLRRYLREVDDGKAQEGHEAGAAVRKRLDWLLSRILPLEGKT